jgi:hypothetical protein
VRSRPVSSPGCSIPGRRADPISTGNCCTQGSPYRVIREWLPPELSADPRLYGGRLSGSRAAAGRRGAAARAPRPLPRAPLRGDVRHGPLRPPLHPALRGHRGAAGGGAVAWLERRAMHRWPRLASPATAAGATILGALAAALLLMQVRLRPQLFERWVSPDFFPLGGRPLSERARATRPPSPTPTCGAAS